MLDERFFCFCSSPQLSHSFHFLVLEGFFVDSTRCSYNILLLFPVERTMSLCPFLNSSVKKLIIVAFYLFSCFLSVPGKTYTQPLIIH